MGSIFKNLLSRRQGSRLSTLDGLARVIGLEKLEQVAIKTVDRRTLIQNAAEASGLEEKSLLVQLANAMKLEIAPEIVPIDLHSVKIEAIAAGYTIIEFRRAGVLPVVRDLKVVAVCCVDPALVDEVLPRLARYPKFLSSWSLISRALDDSELSVRKITEQHKRDDQKRIRREGEARRKASRQVLAALIKEVEGYNVEQFEVCFSSGSIDYSFTTKTGQIAKGSVHASIQAPLRELLAESAREDFVSFELESGVLREGVKIRQGLKDSFVVSWGIPRRELRAADDLATIVAEASARSNLKTDLSQSAESDQVLVDQGTILVIDDNSTFLKVLERFLGRYGFTAITAQHGQEALAILESGKHKIDLIVCDVHMPRMNGREFLAALRKLPALGAIPIIMLTSDLDVEVELQCIESGVDAYVTKSEDPRVLCAQIKRLIERARRKVMAQEAA